MSNLHQSYLYAIEVHDHNAIQALFQRGLDPNIKIDEKDLLENLLSMYTRSPRFEACVKSLMLGGFRISDLLLQAILLDDTMQLKKVITEKPESIHKKYTIESAAYTPLVGVSIIHICAEYNRYKCLQFLLDYGIDTELEAVTDMYGFGGHTPIYHTVNQNNHASEESFRILLEYNANVLHQVKGILWGKGYPWETLIPAVNPISYAMMGLLPQMHRNENTIARVVQELISHAWDIRYPIKNVPNAYLNPNS